MGKPEAGPSYLAIEPWDIARWQGSAAYRRMSLAEQGAYRNLCDRAWQAQPSCELPDDDRELWKLANAAGPADWSGVKAGVFNTDAWAYTDRGTWLNEIVLETFEDSRERHRRAVASGRIAGRASGMARRATLQDKEKKEHRTTVQRPFNDRSTTVQRPFNEIEPVVVDVVVDDINGLTENGGAAPDGAVAARRRKTAPKRDHPWPTSEAVDDYQERYGAGSGNGGAILGALGPLVLAQAKARGEPAAATWMALVRPAWRRYLGFGPGPPTSHPKPSAADFRATFANWCPNGNGSARPAPQQPGLYDAAREGLQRFAARRGVKFDTGGLDGEHGGSPGGAGNVGGAVPGLADGRKGT